MEHDEARSGNLSLSKSAVRRLDAAHADLRMSAVALLRADTASFRMSSAGLAMARGDADLAWSNASFVGAAGDATLNNAGAQLIAAGGEVTVRNGGAAVMAARRIHVERGSVGVLIAQQAELAEGTRVLFKPSGFAALGTGFGVGALTALLLSRLLRRKRR